MPTLDVIQSANAQLASGAPMVAALSGGTTGIGSYIAKALAKVFAKQGSKLRVYIIGRNAERAAAVIAEAQQISPGSDWRFVKASDLALISEVDRCSAEIIAQESQSPFHGSTPHLDLLYMTHCVPILKERSGKSSPLASAMTTICSHASLDTKEGLDSFISTTYYSRIRFILQLLPLLTASPLPGHVISVYAGGFEDGTKPGEKPIGLPPPEVYGVTGVRKYSCFMKTFVFEELAERHAGKLVLTHVYPGLVDGPGFYSSEMPVWFRIVWRLLKPVASLFMTSPEVCGQEMLFLGTSRFPARGAVKGDFKFADGSGVPLSTKGEIGGGSYATGPKGNIQNKGRIYDKVREEGLSQEVWEHTMKTLDEAKERGINARE
ncbi:short-chain dehydrogenase [Colletotrichum karsti]|uniref:Short-chain dehydrogenase n=1 Tax=Colletotrichum karsti TaxID=1095194 RepID=A0A9P6LR19_9PEZI|nr:short-chain dehydrogenase [Colletotrichum karsti]KAF9881657.1 short-chain dehydrogenase [Colletotrichum karsti]